MARVLILQLAIFCSVLCVPVVADEGDVREALRTEIEQLRESGRLSIGGIDVASGNLLAEFYERRGFSPAWHGKSKVGALLDVIVQESRRDTKWFSLYRDSVLSFAWTI